MTLALKNGLLSSAIMLQKYYFDPERLNIHICNIIENLNPYLESNITDVIFVYMIQGTGLDERHFVASIKKLPDNMSTKVMSLYDQLIKKGKEQGIAEGKELGIAELLQKTILNAYDAGIEVSTLRIITSESEEKISLILRRNNRIR